MVAVRRRAWWASHATVKVVVSIHLLVGIAMKLRLELITLLDIEGETAVDCLIGIGWVTLLSEVGLRQRVVLSEWRSRGLRMVRPDITLAIVVEGTIQTALIVSSGQLGVYSAAVEEVRVRVAALSTSALVERAELVIPRFAGKATRIPSTDAMMTMALIHGLAPECEKGFSFGSNNCQYRITAFALFNTYLKLSVGKKRVVAITRVGDRLKSEFVIDRKRVLALGPQVVGFRCRVVNGVRCQIRLVQQLIKGQPRKNPPNRQYQRNSDASGKTQPFPDGQRSNQGEQPAARQRAGGMMRASGNMAPTRPRSGICRLKIRG